MKGECDIPEQWKENKTLMRVSKTVGRPILNTDELTSEDYWEILFDFLGVDKKKIMAI